MDLEALRSQFPHCVRYRSATSDNATGSELSQSAGFPQIEDVLFFQEAECKDRKSTRWLSRAFAKKDFTVQAQTQHRHQVLSTTKEKEMFLQNEEMLQCRHAWPQVSRLQLNPKAETLRYYCCKQHFARNFQKPQHQEIPVWSPLYICTTSFRKRWFGNGSRAKILKRTPPRPSLPNPEKPNLPLNLELNLELNLLRLQNVQALYSLENSTYQSDIKSWTSIPAQHCSMSYAAKVLDKMSTLTQRCSKSRVPAAPGWMIVPHLSTRHHLDKAQSGKEKVDKRVKSKGRSRKVKRARLTYFRTFHRDLELKTFTQHRSIHVGWNKNLPILRHNRKWIWNGWRGFNQKRNQMMTLLTMIKRVAG